MATDVRKASNEDGSCGDCRGRRSLFPVALLVAFLVVGFIHYVEVRTDPSTQLEHRLIAEEIKKILIWKFPITAQALEWIPESE